MKRIFFNILLCFIIASLNQTAQAQGLVNLFADDEPQNSGVSLNLDLSDSKTENKSQSSVDSALKEAEPKKNKGLFSFLNFNEPKVKEVSLNAADQKRLSLIQQSAKLADGGDVKAQLLLGYSYLYGANGATVDYDKSFEYYAKAAMQNDVTGLNNLGSLYYNGIGTPRDTLKAAKLFEKASNLGNVDAAVNLGFILISGNGVAQNTSLAMEYFELAAQKQNPTAQFMLGYAYYTGKHRPKDYIKAAPLIKFAADSGFDEAQYIIALMYINGWGLPQNYNNAVKNLKLAVVQGSSEAMVTLGDILARGERYNKDFYTAHVMFNLASVRGAANATSMRSQLEAKMKIDEVLAAQTEAERYHSKPSELSNYIRQTFGSNIRYYIDKE